MPPTPFSLFYRQPAEWDLHRACWLAWPSHSDLWQSDLERAQAEFVVLCRAISGVEIPSASQPEEPLEILVLNPERRRQAEKALQGLPCRFHAIPFGDIWLRDTAPIFVRSAEGTAGVRFGFNGWGEKYLLPYDGELAGEILKVAGVPAFRFPFVLEGGSIDVDGEGTCLTTRQCLLNPNRNPGWSEKDIEAGLKEALGIEKVIWLDEGLINDHTDGHVDTLARFVAPGKVICMAPSGSDPNAQALDSIYRVLSRATDARGRALEVISIPSPGRVESAYGKLLPASYLNFYIANRTVAVPCYGTDFDRQATETIARCFPERKTLGLPARAILTGGGAFHCITQQQPAGSPR